MEEQSRAQLIHDQLRQTIKRKIDELPDQFYKEAEEPISTLSDEDLISLSNDVDRYYKKLATVIAENSSGNQIEMGDIFDRVANDERIQEEYKHAREIAMKAPAVFIPVIIEMESSATTEEEKMNVLSNFYVLAEAITSHFSPVVRGEAKFITSALEEQVPLFSYN